MQIIVLDVVEKFSFSLDKEMRMDLIRVINLLFIKGKDLRMPHTKRINKDLFELRTLGKQNIRLIYAFRDEVVYILHVFVKKQSKIPDKEIKLALKRLALLRSI